MVDQDPFYFSNINNNLNQIKMQKEETFKETTDKLVNHINEQVERNEKCTNTLLDLIEKCDLSLEDSQVIFDTVRCLKECSTTITSAGNCMRGVEQVMTKFSQPLETEESS